MKKGMPNRTIVKLCKDRIIKTYRFSILPIFPEDVEQVLEVAVAQVRHRRKLLLEAEMPGDLTSSDGGRNEFAREVDVSDGGPGGERGGDGHCPTNKLVVAPSRVQVVFSVRWVCWIRVCNPIEERDGVFGWCAVGEVRFCLELSKKWRSIFNARVIYFQYS